MSKTGEKRSAWRDYRALVSASGCQWPCGSRPLFKFIPTPSSSKLMDRPIVELPPINSSTTWKYKNLYEPRLRTFDKLSNVGDVKNTSIAIPPKSFCYKQGSLVRKTGRRETPPLSGKPNAQYRQHRLPLFTILEDEPKAVHNMFSITMDQLPTSKLGAEQIDGRVLESTDQLRVIPPRDFSKNHCKSSNRLKIGVFGPSGMRSFEPSDLYRSCREVLFDYTIFAWEIRGPI